MGFAEHSRPASLEEMEEVSAQEATENVLNEEDIIMDMVEEGHAEDITAQDIMPEAL